MKKLYLFISVIIFSISYAQINLTTDPNTVTLPNNSSVFLDASSAYDNDYIGSNNEGKGLVFPQVDLTTFQFNITTPDGAAILPTFYDGMVVYNIGSGTTLNDTTLAGVQVEVKPGFYYFYNPNGRTNLNVTTGKWVRFGGGNDRSLANYLNVTYAGSTGTWVQNYTATGNTISFKISNSSNLSFRDLDFNSSVSLAGAKAGLSLTPAEDYSSVNMDAGTVKVFTYNVSGTPTDNGTLTANFQANGGLFAYGNIEIAPQSGVRAIGLDFVGDYTSNKKLASVSHSVALKIRNFSLNPLSNADLSNVINLSSIEGLALLPNQNTNVTLQPNEEITLTYSLEGIAPQPGTLKATFVPNTKVSGNRTATKEVELFGNVTAQNMEINGSYIWGQFMTPENTVTLGVTNNNAFNLYQIDLSEALTLSGAVNDVKVATGQNTSIDIAAGETKTITYTLSGSSMVEDGGTLTATFRQAPFPTLTAEKEVIGNNGFYATPNVITLPKEGGTYTFDITSSKPWEYELLNDTGNWMSVTGTTGTNGNGTISISTQSKTSQYAQVGYIKIKRPSNGTSITIAVNQEPTDAFEITNFTSEAPNFAYNPGSSKHPYYASIHQNKTSTFTTNQNNLQIYGDLPKFIENVSFESNKIILTPKERLESGEPTYGEIRFSYGKGYLTNPITIYQNAKAYQCPANSPVRPDNGYKIWNSTQKFNGNIFTKLIEERPGIDNFNDYSYSNNSNNIILTPIVVQNNNQSSLFVSTKGRYFSDGAIFSFSSENAKYKYAYFYRTDKAFRSIYSPYLYSRGNPDLSNSVVESVVVCADGADEDTPDVEGDAGWRK